MASPDFYNDISPKMKMNLDSPAKLLQSELQTELSEEEQAQRADKENQSGFDKNSIRLFNQAYARKLKVVVAPVFKKYENILKIKRQDFAINSYTGTKSLFSVSSGDVSASMAIEYDGIEHALVRLTIMDDEHKRLFETETIDFTILDYKRMSLMLSELIDKFIIILKKKNK